MDFGDIALVALIGGGIYWYVNKPVEAFEDVDKFPITTNQDGTKQQTRNKDDGSKVEVLMKTNGFFRITSTPKPGADGKVSVSDISILFYNDEGALITAEQYTNDTVLAGSALNGLQGGGGYVANGGNPPQNPIDTNVNPSDFSQVPPPPTGTNAPSYPGNPGFPGQSGFSPPPGVPPPVPNSSIPQTVAPPNPGYVGPSGFPTPQCLQSPFGLPMWLPNSPGNCR